MRKSTLIWRADRSSREELQKPKSIAGKSGATGFDEGLAEEEGEAGAEQDQGDADGHVVDPAQAAKPSMEQAQGRADEAGHERAEPCRTGEVGDAVRAHRAHDERPFEAEIDPPALLGDALAEADEEKRGADADRAGAEGERDAPRAHAGRCCGGHGDTSVAAGLTVSTASSSAFATRADRRFGVQSSRP
jgi:hypothetical protein